MMQILGTFVLATEHYEKDFRVPVNFRQDINNFDAVYHGLYN